MGDIWGMKQEKRVEQTKQALQDSLLRLMEKKSLEKITVKEICDGADVNRSTFYVYYGSPREVLEGAKAALCERVRQMPRDYENIQGLVDKIVSAFYGQREMILLLLRDGEVGWMMDVFDVFRDDLVMTLQRQGISAERAQRTWLYNAAGMCAVLARWIVEHPEGMGPEIMEELYGLTMQGLGVYLH